LVAERYVALKRFIATFAVGTWEEVLTVFFNCDIFCCAKVEHGKLLKIFWKLRELGRLFRCKHFLQCLNTLFILIFVPIHNYIMARNFVVVNYYFIVFLFGYYLSQDKFLPLGNLWVFSPRSGPVVGLAPPHRSIKF